MHADALHAHHPLLSGLTADNEDAGDAEIAEKIASAEFAITCKSQPTDTVRAYVEAGIAPATRRARRADLEHFEAWGGILPATDAQVTCYLAAHATALKVSTLTRRLAAISVAHEAKGLPNLAASPLVRATMRGIRRAHGVSQRQAKPLLREDLFVVLAAMGDRLKDLRDLALLLIGFAGGLRRSELAAIDPIDFERVREGIVLTIRRSKTDQDGVGRRIGIPFGRTVHCPVKALVS
jgi:integrase